MPFSISPPPNERTRRQKFAWVRPSSSSSSSLGRPRLRQIEEEEEEKLFREILFSNFSHRARKGVGGVGNFIFGKSSSFALRGSLPFVRTIMPFDWLLQVWEKEEKGERRKGGEVVREGQKN